MCQLLNAIKTNAQPAGATIVDRVSGVAINATNTAAATAGLMLSAAKNGWSNEGRIAHLERLVALGLVK